MINISEATAIALHSMIYICARSNETVTLKDISAKFDISENHLSKVLQRLVKAGYLTSSKGPKGGFRIAEGKEKSSFMDIYEVTEGSYKRRDCLFNNKASNCCCCLMSPLLNNINNEFEKFMTTHKINEFAL